MTTFPRGSLSGMLVLSWYSHPFSFVGHCSQEAQETRRLETLPQVAKLGIQAAHKKIGLARQDLKSGSFAFVESLDVGA